MSLISKFLPLLAVSLLCCILCHPAEGWSNGFAPVRNFNRQNYNAGSQNRGMAQDIRGRIYVANRDGLLRYDGSRWKLFRLPDFSAARCVAIDSDHDRILIGGSGIFGYFEPDDLSAGLHFTNLSDRLPPAERNFSEIWNVMCPNPETTIYQGDYRLFMYNSKGVQPIPTAEKILSSACIGQTLYAALQNGRLCRLDGLRLLELPGCAELHGKQIAAILPYGDGGLLVATAFNGLYTYADGLLLPLVSDISDFLCRNQLLCAAFNGDCYAFGTVNRGAVITDFSTGESSYINTDTGMQNNMVLGMGFDFNDNLWLCLDNGIDYAMTHSPVRKLLGSSFTAGAGYASMTVGDMLLLGTDTGLFSTPYPIPALDSPPTLRKLLSGQVWSIDSIGKSVLVSTDQGLFDIADDGSPRRVGDMTVGCRGVRGIPGHPDKALISSRRDFYIMEKANGSWGTPSRLQGFRENGGKFIIDKGGDIWLDHSAKGLYRLRLSDDMRSIRVVRLYTEADGLSVGSDNALSLYKGKVVVSTPSGKFMTFDDKGRLSDDKTLSDAIPACSTGHLHQLTDGSAIFATASSVWRLVRDRDGHPVIDSTSYRGVGTGLIPGFEHVGMLGDNTALLSHQDGFFCLDLRTRRKKSWNNGVFIEAVYANNDSLIYLASSSPDGERLSIPYSMNSLLFEFAAPEFRQPDAILFSFMLENYDKEWSTPSPQASKEYTRLHEGEYTLRLKAYNRATGEMAETTYSFEVRPPWFRTWPAKILYLLFGAAILYCGVKALVRHSQKAAGRIRQQKELELSALKEEKEQEALLKDSEIEALKSEQLELDIKHKSSELSNVTMTVIRKNEILLDIDSQLEKLRHKVADKENEAMFNEIEKIKSQINRNISHDDDLKNLNQNFDIVHRDFTRTLMELHPDLTTSERRLCCYLKMGLSSKEIAPLLNISSKSVEMNRYRLRKKLNLDRSDNLTAYLQNL